VVSALKPHLAPAAGHFTWRERLESLLPVWGIIALFVLVMGSMYAGIATPPEASAIGATGAFLLMLFKRRLTWSRFVEALLRSAETTAMVTLLLLGGFALSYVASTMGIAHGLSQAITDSNLSPLAVILAYNLLLILLGTALETSTIIVITMPLLFPAFMKLGFDPLWLGVLTTINAEIGTISPPSGLVLFAIKGIAPKDFTTKDLYMAVLPFNVVVALFLIVMIAFPELSTWLPGQMK
jgi:tripartite ATP-independent transporter DctM subunit